MSEYKYLCSLAPKHDGVYIATLNSNMINRIIDTVVHAKKLMVGIDRKQEGYLVLMAKVEEIKNDPMR